MKTIDICISLILFASRFLESLGISGLVASWATSKFLTNERVAPLFKKYIKFRRAYPDHMPAYELHYTRANTDFCCHFGRFQKDKRNVVVDSATLRFVLRAPSLRVACNREICTGCAFRPYVEFHEKYKMTNRRITIASMYGEDCQAISFPVIKKDSKEYVVTCKGWDGDYLYLETSAGLPIFVRIYLSKLKTNIDGRTYRDSKMVISDFEQYQFEHKKVNDYWENGIKNLKYNYKLEDIQNVYAYEIENEELRLVPVLDESDAECARTDLAASYVEHLKKAIYRLDLDERSKLAAEYKKIADDSNNSVNMLKLIVWKEGEGFLDEIVTPKEDAKLIVPESRNIKTEEKREPSILSKIARAPMGVAMQLLDDDRQSMNRFTDWMEVEKHRIFKTLIYLNVVLAVVAFVYSVRKRIGNRYRL